MGYFSNMILVDPFDTRWLETARLFFLRSMWEGYRRPAVLYALIALSFVLIYQGLGRVQLRAGPIMVVFAGHLTLVGLHEKGVAGLSGG